MLKGDPILDIRHLVVEFGAGRRRRIQAVADVSFQMNPGETLGLVGESGCGKTSIARAVVQLPRPTSGNVFFHGEDITRVGRKRLRCIRPRLQMIFQDSIAALNPRRTVGGTIAMPLRINGRAAAAGGLSEVRKMMAATGLDPAAFHRRPYQLSGGQCQLVQIARALMTDPQLLICDEPVSALDVSIQAQIINLLEKMRRHHGLTMLIISHDMAVVKNMCDRVAVMYLGKIVEIASSIDLYKNPLHPYTQALLSAVPIPDPSVPRANRIILKGDVPSPIDPPPGCSFHPRCLYAKDTCRQNEPLLNEINSGHFAACFFAGHVGIGK